MRLQSCPPKLSGHLHVIGEEVERRIQKIIKENESEKVDQKPRRPVKKDFLLGLPWTLWNNCTEAPSHPSTTC